MEVGERPVHEVEIEIVEAADRRAIAAGGDDVVFAVLVVPQL
jgi:hypothetical protein